MKVSKISLSAAAFVCLFLTNAVLVWADKIPVRRPSDYGDQTSQVQLTTPSFTTVTQDGVTLGLDSVFCNSCSLPSSPTNLEYFFDITLAPGANLASLTFGPGFDTADLQNFGVVQFDNSLDGNPCESGGLAGGAYVCNVPISSAGLDFSTVTSTVTCAADGSCTVNFTNFNFTTLGSGKIILSATTPFGGPTSLSDPTTGQPLTPSVKINGGSSVSVTEPSSLWFVAISSLACLGVITRRRTTSSTRAC